MNTRFPVPQFVISVLQRLESAGFEAFLVGGCVRDQLLGRKVHDYDIATNAKPLQVVPLFETVIATGLQHGTVTVLTEQHPVEITTYRIDGKYTDGRHPDTVQFATNIKEDLGRRDFTMNAIAIDLHGNVVDPFAGSTHLKQKKIQSVGDATARFAEDSLRILRGLRFASELEFSIEEATLQAMNEQSNALETVSPERIGYELDRISAANWWFIADLLAKERWLQDTHPRLTEVRTALQSLLQHRLKADQWYRSIDALPQTVIKKRQTGFLATVMSTDQKAAGAVLDTFQRMGWPKKLCKQAYTAAVLVLDDMEHWSVQRWRKSLFNFNSDTVELACRISDWFQLDNPPPERGTESTLEKYQQYVLLQPLFTLRDLCISGNDIVQTGAHGPQIGAIKRRLAEEVLSGLIQNEKLALLHRARDLLKEILAHDS